MNLAEAISSAHHAESSKTCQHLVCLIWDEMQPKIAKIGFSKLVESFTNNAGGSYHHAASPSTHLATLVP